MTNLRVGDTFPDFELTDHRKKMRRLSEFTRPGATHSDGPLRGTRPRA
jgi:peroxiredoxin